MIKLIGSSALAVSGFRLGRAISDIDIVGSYDEVTDFLRSLKPRSLLPLQNGKKLVAKFDKPVEVCGIESNVIEADIAWMGSTSEYLLEDHDPLEIAYVLKMSHRYLKNSPHFLKTMGDIKFMRRELGAAFTTNAIQNHWDFYLKRMEETYDYSHPSLNKSKEKFFSGDGVNYVYDHDSIHESVKICDVPAYTRFSSGEVLSSRIRFESLPFEYRLDAVREESMVLAIERSLVPFPGEKTPKEAYLMALEKVCTSITSGWFREFAWENYEEAARYDADFAYNRFCRDVINFKVKMYGG